MSKSKVSHCIFSVGTVDAVCTSAALMRHLKKSVSKKVQIYFDQVNNFKGFDFNNLNNNSLVTLIGLSVNEDNEQDMLNFIKKIISNGHTIYSIIDVNDAKSWEKILEQINSTLFVSLSVKPTSKEESGIESLGELLLKSIKFIDRRVIELCIAGSSAQKMDFKPRLSDLVDRSTKSRILIDKRRFINDDLRRNYLVHYLSEGNVVADDLIASWINEYDKTISTHEKIKKNVQCITKGVIRINISDEIVDLPKLLHDFYLMNNRVVFVEEIKSNNKSCLSIWSCDKNLNILDLLKDKVELVLVTRECVSIDLKYEKEAIELILDGIFS